MPQDLVLCEPSEVPESMQNQPPFEKSPGKNDELGAESKAPIRRTVEACAKDTPVGQRARRGAEVAREVVAPSDERQSTGSMLDGCGNSSHYGCLSTAGMGKECRDGFSDGGISQESAWMRGAGSTLSAWRIAPLAACVRQDQGAFAGASRRSRRGRSPRRRAACSGNSGKRMEMSEEVRVVRT